MLTGYSRASQWAMEDSGSEAPPCWHPLPFWLPPRVLRIFSPKYCNSLLWRLTPGLHKLCRFGLTDTPHGAIGRGSSPSEELGPGFDQACIRNSFRQCINWSRPGPTYCCVIPTQWRLAARAAGLFVRTTPRWWGHTRCDWFATRHTPLRRAHLQLWRMGRLHGYPWSLVQTRHWSPCPPSTTEWFGLEGTRACINSFLQRAKKSPAGQRIAPRRPYPHPLEGG